MADKSKKCLAFGDFSGGVFVLDIEYSVRALYLNESCLENQLECLA